MESGPLKIIDAPSIAPIMVWDEEDGIAKYQVIILHAIALIRAKRIASILNAYRSNSSFPRVLATAVPKMNGPTRLPIAAIRRAILIDVARDAIIVATTVQLSWKPFRNAYETIKTIIITKYTVIIC